MIVTLVSRFLEHELAKRRLIERAVTKRGTTVATTEECTSHTEIIWASLSALAAEAMPPDPALTAPWVELVLRSEVGWRARCKPHGYAGDYRLMELFYDLEHVAGQRPGRSVSENLVDHFLVQSDGVRLVRERARRLEAIVTQAAKDGAQTILDVGGGGARYVRRALEALQSPRPQIFIYDQDLTLPHFWAAEVPQAISSKVQVISKPVKAIHTNTPSQPFALVLSSGLFDYLDQATAQDLAAHLWSLTAPGGRLVIANILETERAEARLLRHLLDWTIVNRSDADMTSLLPGVDPATYTAVPEFDLGIVEYRKD